MKNCLLLIDLQNDYFPGGAMELVNIVPAAANAGILLDRFRKAGLPVIHVQHIAVQPGATFFLPGTPGAGFFPLLNPHPAETVIVKHFPNSFRNTPLLQTLRDAGIDNLTVCGAMSHMCLDATTRAAFDLGFTCIVVDDACATRDLEHRGTVVPANQVHAAFMAALSRPYARVVATDDALPSAV